jgi:hypothetical protein
VKSIRFAMIFLVLIAINGGCDSIDQRAVQIATESAERQAEQNQVIADLGRKTSESQRRIVEAVASSRSELVELQKDVAEQRKQLDAERKAIASERRYESFLAEIAGPAGWTVLAALPLVLCWLALSDLRASRSDDHVICQLLVDEFLPAQPNNRLSAPEQNCLGVSNQSSEGKDEGESDLPF